MTKISKGWVRILIVLSVIWVTYIGAITTINYKSINEFDQFDENAPEYTFWEWKQINPSKTDAEGWESSGRELTLKLTKVTLFTTLPLATIWLFAWAIVWIKEGFSSDKNS